MTYRRYCTVFQGVWEPSLHPTVHDQITVIAHDSNLTVIARQVNAGTQKSEAGIGLYAMVLPMMLSGRIGWLYMHVHAYYRR